MLFLQRSYGNVRRMDENHNRPITRDDLLFTVEMALRKAERFWPKKRLPGDHDRLKPVARKVIEHLDLCGMRVFGKARGPGHSTPDPWGGLRQDGKPDGRDG